MCNKRRRQQGVTIVELVMFIVIVGIAAAGLLHVMDLANRNSTDPIRRKQAMLIAEAYMEEVQQAQFTACDPADAHAGTAIHAAVNLADPSDLTYCADNNKVEGMGPEGGNTRPFDNVNDYAGLNYVEGNQVRAFAKANVDTDVSDKPLGANLGNVQLGSFTTMLALRRVALPNIAAEDVLEITITVNYGSSESVVLQGYRTRYEPRAL